MKDLNLTMDSHCIPNVNYNLGVPQSVDVSQYKCQNPTNTGISDVNGTCIESLSKKTNFMVKSDGNLSDPFQVGVWNETNTPDIDYMNSDTTKIAPEDELNEQMMVFSDEKQVPLPIQDNIRTNLSQNNYQPSSNQILMIYGNRILATLDNKLRYYVSMEYSLVCKPMVFLIHFWMV